MGITRRVVWGHALVGIGAFVRAASAPLAAGALLILVLAAVAPIHLGVGPAVILLAPPVLLLLGRLAALGFGALGWIVLPARHRALLAELAARAQKGLQS